MGKKVIALVFGVLLLDQILKIWIKTHMSLGEEFSVLGDWFYIHFTENPGMAFGMEFGGNLGKLLLSLFRIVAVVGIAYWLRTLIKEKAHKGFIIAISFVLAGAAGNILDSMFYGMFFNSSDFQVAEFLSSEGGYAPFLYGYVVDMLYFPLVSGSFPDWLPIWGGEYFVFFRPVFNIADVSISVGIGFILLRQKTFFAKEGELEGSSAKKSSVELADGVGEDARDSV